MGFNLRNFLEESIAQINPFDGGKTAATVRAARNKPAPAQTIKAPRGQLQPSASVQRVSPVQRATSPLQASSIAKPIRIGDISYTKNKNGTYTNSAGQIRTQQQLDAIRGIQNNYETTQQKIKENASSLRTMVGDFGNSAKKFGEYANPIGEKGLFGTEQQKLYKKTTAPITRVTQNIQDRVNANDKEEGFQWSSGGDYGRFALNLLPGMIQGLTEAPDKVASGISGKRIDQQGGVEDLNLLQRAGSFVDGGISIAGLGWGGSGTLLKAVAGRAAPAYRGVVNAALNTAKAAGTEGIEEGVQTFASDLADNGRLDATAQDYLTSIGLGALGGGMMHGAGVGINAVKNYGPEVASKVAQEASPTLKARNHPSIIEQDKYINELTARKEMTKNKISQRQIQNAIDVAVEARNAEYQKLYRQYKRKNEGGFIAGPLAGDFSKAEKAGRVFEGVDGKPRFEVDDSGAKLNTQAISKVALEQKTGNARMKLGEALDHKELFKQYPELKNADINFTSGTRENGKFWKDRDGVYQVEINSDRSLSEQKATLLHEIQHAIQRTEGFARGGSDAEFGIPMQKKYDQLNAQLTDYNNKLRDAVGKPEYNDIMNEKLALVKEIQSLEGKQTGTIQEKAIDEYRKFAGEAEARAVASRMNMSDGERYKSVDAVEYTKPKPVIKTDNSLNLQNKDDVEQLARIFGQERAEQLAKGDYTHWRNPDGTLKYWEDLAKRKIVSEKPKTVAQQLQGRINPVKVNDSRLYHGTTAENKHAIMSGGFKKGSQLSEDAFRGGGYGAMQDSISFSTDPKTASAFTGSASRGVVVETKLKDGARVVTVDGVDYAEDLNDMIPELRKQGVDAVYLEGEKEVAVINPKAVEKPTNATEFTPSRAKEDLAELFKKESVKSTFYDSLDVPKEDLIIRNGDGKAMSVDPKSAPIENTPQVGKTDPITEVDPVAAEYIQETSAKYATPEEYRNALIDEIWGRNKVGKSVETTLIPEENGYGFTGRSTVSNNSQFYRDFYREYGRKPSRKAIADIVDQELTGKDGEYAKLLDSKDMNGEIPYAKDIYEAIRDQSDALETARDTTDYSVAFDNNLRPTLQDALSGKDTRVKATKVKRTANSQPKAKSTAQNRSKQPRQVSKDQTGNAQNRATSAKKSTSPAQGQAPVREQITSKQSGLSSKDKVSQKQPIVNEQRRAIKQGASETYGLLDSFNEADNVPQELKDSLGAFGNQRTVKSNKELWANAQNRTRDTGEAYKYFTDNNNDEAVATGYALINKYMKEGNTKQAGDIAMTMAERALASGRQTQAYAMMKKLTPEGQIAYVARKVQKFIDKNPKKADKVKWNDEVQKKLYKMAEEVATMPDGRARALKIGEMQRVVDDIFPSSLADKAITVWKAGLLTSLRTHERNMVGNTLNLASEQVATAPGSLADRLMSLRTGKRTLVTSTGEGIGKGAKYGGQIAKDQIMTGIDVTDSNLKMNMNHITWGDSKVEKALKVYTETVFRTLGAEDKVFREAARTNSYYNQAIAEAATRKLKGAEADAFVQKRVNNPTPEMLDLAEQDSGRATFTHDNVLGDLVKSGKQALRSSKTNSKAGGMPAAVGDVIVPFTQVPTGVASQLYAYSPAKMVKSLYDIGKVIITGDSTLQRKAAQGFGRSTVGTAVLGAGVYLASKGLMTGQPEDEAERAQWEAEGKSSNSIKVGDRWYQLGSIGPQTLLLLAGAQAQKDAKEGRDPVVLTASNLGKNFKDQTFLKGMSSALDALDDPKRYGNSFVESLVTSTVPNIVKDVAKATDDTQRNAIGIKDKLKQAVPGMSKDLPERLDSYGQPLKNRGIGAMLDLFNSTKEKDVPEATYIDALRESIGTKDHVPTKAYRSITINGETRKLTSQEHTDYQRYIGEKGKKFIGDAMNTPAFQKLPTEEQANKIDKALKDINSAAKYELFGNISKSGKLNKNVAAIVNDGGAKVDSSMISGSVNISDKISPASTATLNKYYEMDDDQRQDWFSTENDAEYKYYKAKYENDKANGDISEIQDIKRSKLLAKDKIGARYRKEARDLYSLSKSDIATYLSRNKDGNKLASQLLEYDKRLYDAGLVGYLKFKYGIGDPSDSYGSSRSSRGGSKSAKGKFDYKLDMFSKSGSGGTNKQLYDLLKKARMKQGV